VSSFFAASKAETLAGIGEVSRIEAASARAILDDRTQPFDLRG
jgi:hypothetical protein